ncbi:hypothetical protein GQ607_013842 [Colletotrichum asianum]|uniref:Uncharacterized protein n=1 Tax=Colletotrichum asianum TaxID=702518 RepID=A0A8H3W0I7_9PEZI|nr:hypothetical protein GQ607_013842 [Colletotrichum asianum]
MREFFSRRSGRFRRTAPPSDGPATPAPSALHPPPEPFPSGIKLLHNPSEAALVDIVFVHGLTGHREKTWTAHDATDPWPKTLLPTKIPTARVLTFGYDASVADWRSVVSVNRVGNHAQNLLSALANFREDGDTNERPLIFVCHSLGGIVCEDALVSSLQRPEKHLKAILAATKGIIFMGTPHHGSGLAAWAEKLSMSIGLLKQTNTDIVRVLRSDSETLARIQDSFHTMIQSRNREGQGRIEITCFYEELPLPGVGLVVTQDSAILPGYVPIGLRNNHQDMTKFSALEDPGFIAVCAELRRWNKEMRMPSTLQAPIIHESSKIRESELPQAHFIVPYNENIDFIGRHQILNQLRQDFQHDPRCSKEKGRSRISLYGLGGIGKTQIALAYAYWLRDVRPDISIFWVHASNPERFQQAFMRIAEECNIPDHQNPSVDILSLVHAWLLRSKHAPWFMIIDNADDTSMFFQDVQKIPRMSVLNAHEKSTRTLGQFVPECRHGSILITTRNKQAGQRLAPGRPPFEVPKLNDEESAQMIRIMTGDGQLSLMTASNLSSQLEHLPLAIAQASAFIQENSMTIERYQELLNESDKTVARLLSAEFGTVGQDSAIPRSVMSTWVVSFEQIKKQSPLAIEILSLIAFFDRQAIPIGLLSVYFDKVRPSLLNRHLYSGKSSTMTENQEDFVTQNGVGQAINTDRVEIGHNTTEHIPGKNDHGDQKTKGQHFMKRSRSSSKFSIPMGKFLTDSTDASDTGAHGDYRSRAYSSRTDSMSSKASEEDLTLNAISVAGTNFSDEESLRAIIQGSQPLDRWEKKSQMEKTEQKHKRDKNKPKSTHLGRYDITASAPSAMSFESVTTDSIVDFTHFRLPASRLGTLQNAGNRTNHHDDCAAESPGQEILVEVETAIGILKAFCIISISKEREKHFDLHRLVQLATKRWIQEEELHEKFAAGALQTLAQAFPDGTFESMSVCKSLLPHAHAVLENKCRQIYEDALAAATIRRDLSSFYVNTGQLEVAAKISQRNLASSKLILGETNPVLLKVMRQLIEIYKYLGDYENSKELFEKLLPLQHEVFPNDHSEVLHGTLISAKEHRSQGSFTEAERLLRGALYQCNMHAMDERMYFSVRIRLMLELALVLSDAGHFELAKEWSLQTEKITRHTFGKHHPLALRVYWALACIYKQQGQLENAAETCRRALNDRDITHDHAQTLLLDVKALLGAVLHDQGWLEEAGRIQSEILDIANTFYKQDPLRILDFMNPLVATREAQGRLQEACELKSQVVEIATTLLGPDHPGVVEHTRLLALLDEKRDIGGIEYKSSSSDVA